MPSHGMANKGSCPEMALRRSIAAPIAASRMTRRFCCKVRFTFYALAQFDESPFCLIQRTMRLFEMNPPGLAIWARIKNCLDRFALLIEFRPLGITEKDLGDEFIPVRRT